MNVTQQYSKPSTAKSDAKGSTFDFSAEVNRKPVNLNALIKDSGSYARVMLALRQVVVGDWRTKQVDYSAYQEWVNEQYLKELPNYLGDMEQHKMKLMQEKEDLALKRRVLSTELSRLKKGVSKARRQYYDWLYKHDKDKWYVLDPVISVHEDAVIFEAFSLDESVYGRVSVPSHKLETFGKTEYGTTNIDFSQPLADELYRVRSYRPAWLNVTYDSVSMSTDIGESVEKKIDLPETWVRGFLQVQSASSLEGTNFQMKTQTMANVLGILERNKEKEGPRSLRFKFEKGKPVEITIEPWNMKVQDTMIYDGEFEGEIRLWGRKRFTVLKDLLTLSDVMDIKMLGTGMPSYWSVDVNGHRLDVGFSGWTANDWAGKANFDLLASTGKANQELAEKAFQLLMQKLTLTPKELATYLQVEQHNATALLQELCKSGQAMYDHLVDQYRYRQLIVQDIEVKDAEEVERNSYAISLYKDGKVTLTAVESNEYNLEVEGKNTFKTKLKLDKDGKVQRAECTCSFFRRNKLRQGPCGHLVASVLFVQNMSNIQSSKN
ncbi:hypothetical protein [Aureivirga sp. CE67]|uniref:hypothetical protein n=1 Tax=Aureivirga sp. CE67 TaxID=1788983 RepID=UPI0018CBA478|nr:hypothetical protein [Aureivirga sp. CE67]